MTLIASGRRFFNERTLPVQIGASGALAAMAGGALVALGSAPQHWPLVAAAAAGALGAALIGAALAWRSRRALERIADAAHALRSDDAPATLEIPLADCSEELRHASVNLRRMVEAARRRQQLLEERNAALEQRLAARTHELTTLQDLSIGLASKSDLHELVAEALAALGQAMDYASSSLWARGDRGAGGPVVLLGYKTRPGSDPPGSENLIGMRLSRANLQRYEQIAREKVPLIENRSQQSLLSWLWSKVTDDARSSELYKASRSWMAVPLRYRDEVLGVMRVDHQDADYFDAERARLLTAVGSQAALAMRHAQLQALQRDVAVTAERNRIARDLHDAVSQTLFAANVLAGTLARTAARSGTVEADRVIEQALALETLNRGALAEMRQLMFELRPDALPNTPLHELLQNAVDALTCRGDIAVAYLLSRDAALPPEVRVQIYRIAQEALSNLARHSGATHCRIDFTADGSRSAKLRISDDGHGFDPEQPRPGHFGLGNMRERAQEIGATIWIASAPDAGTEVRVEWESPAP